MLRSPEGERGNGALPSVLAGLATTTVAELTAGAAALRKLVRIKVEDDQDIVTARRAVAEAGYFLVALKEEAPRRGLSEAELLQRLELGEA